MAWLFSCIKPSVREEGSPGRRSSHQDNYEHRWNHRHCNRIVNYVELLRHLDEPLGLVVRGGSDQETPVYIEALRPGGVALKSDALQVNDHIQAINGIATDRLTQREVLSLLKSAGTVINLEVSYEVPAEYDDSRDDVQIKTMAVQLFREGSSFGFTIRGGREENRPITIAHIVQHTMVYRAGIVKVGDRVLQINGCNMESCSQFDALTILRGASEMVTMVIEYEVELQDEKLTNATDPLLVKILKPPSSTFGISLSGASSPGSPIWITEVKQGSIADRCGALNVGDQLLSVNNHMLDMCSVQDAAHLIMCSDIHMELQIMPAHNFTSRPGFGNSLTTDSVVVCDMTTLPPSRHPSTDSLATSVYPGITSHPETVTVTVNGDNVGFGINLKGGATDHHNRPITIAEVIPDGPAFRLGQLKAGDKILTINGISLEGVTLHAAIKLANEMKECVTMTVEFEVEDPMIPKVGSLDIKLVKIGMSLGITINGAQTPGAPVWISDMKKGGAAYRTGLIKAGDVIIAINGQSCDYITLDEAVTMLKRTGEVVYLKIKKDGNIGMLSSVDNSDTVTYSVQLNRDNQELGIILGISNTGEFMIKALMDGVARKTGTVKTGSYILAINGDSLAGKTITQVEQLLENCGNAVTLKIKKNIKQPKPRSKQPSPVGRESRRDTPFKQSSTLALSGIPTLESAAQDYSFLKSMNDDDDDYDVNVTERPHKSSTLPNVFKRNDMTTDTDTNRGSFTEDEMSSLDDDGVEQSKTRRALSKDDSSNKLYQTFSHNKLSRISQIPVARAVTKRGSLTRRRQLEDLEDSSEIKQIQSALIESEKYLHKIGQIAEPPSSSDPDSDYEPAYKGRHRRYASNKFTQCIQQRVRLVKTDYNPDFGFSISDSANEPGIYIHKVKPGGPAEANGLKPYDRILKINEYPVRQLDCSRVLPLLGMCGNEVNLLVSRNMQISNGNHLLQQTEEI